MNRRSHYLIGTVGVAGLCGSLFAGTVAVPNGSFEDPAVTGAGGFYQSGTPTGFTVSGFSTGYIERSDNGGFGGGVSGQPVQPGITGANGQYTANDLSAGATGTFYEDVGVTFQPFTTYTVDLAGGKRAGFAGPVMNFGLQSSSAVGTDLSGATIGFLNEGALADGTFISAASAGANGGDFTFTTGAIVPTGDLEVFIRATASTGGARLHADSFSITTAAAPEPASLGLLTLSAGSLLMRRRQRA